MASILSTVTASSLLISLGLCKLCSQGHSQKVKYPLPCMKSVKLQSQTHHQWDRKVYDAHKVVKKSVTLKNNITYRCIIGSCPHFADKKVGCRQEKVWRVFFSVFLPTPAPTAISLEALSIPKAAFSSLRSFTQMRYRPTLYSSLETDDWNYRVMDLSPFWLRLKQRLNSPFWFCAYSFSWDQEALSPPHLFITSAFKPLNHPAAFQRTMQTIHRKHPLAFGCMN